MAEKNPPVLVLGAGLVGRVIALDLAADEGRRVTVVDRDQAALDAIDGVETICGDCADQAFITDLSRGHGLVVGALPSGLGLGALEAVIRAGTSMCDISFMAEDARVLDALALEQGVTAVVDCGVAPGMSNILAATAAQRLDPCRSIIIRVGGLPVDRSGPWAYKAPFSPGDVIEEYLRPARVVAGGTLQTRPALDDLCTVEVPRVGVLEAFTTDGLRSLVDTLDVPDMIEQTLRYEGYRDRIALLRDSGLLDETPVRIDGVDVRPRDVTCSRLFDLWRYEPGEADLTVMRVEACGDLDGEPARLVWDLYDEYDPETGYLSMARTTGFPATIVARAIESGVVDRPGVHPPEMLAGIPGFLEDLMAQLERRGVRYEASVHT